jgi:hypothetical protein
VELYGTNNWSMIGRASGSFEHAVVCAVACPAQSPIKVVIRIIPAFEIRYHKP